MEKYPILIARLILSLFTMGNLLQSYGTNVRFAIGGAGFILFAAYVTKLLVSNKAFKKRIRKSRNCSIFPTITMAAVLLAGYIKSFMHRLPF